MKSRLNKIVNIFITFSTLLSFSNAITLDETGAYSLVVSIDETTVQNSIANYVDNIKRGVQDLSDLLHYTTKGKFSFKTVDILVPSHWNVQTDDVATSQYDKDSDIKISHRYFIPNVNNPNPCGKPGKDILLPYNFFDDPKTGVYGRIGLALLTQFVRLRFGAWEEHGYPGDSLFPYYWKPLDETTWRINACTNVPLLGQYKNYQNGSECGPDPEDVDNLYPPPGDCRFFPENVQPANTSMMSFHYLANMEAFCDFTNHDRRAPTPQNYFCKYKSVMEVLETCPDWTQVTKDNVAGVVDFKVVKTAASPLLYVLLDGGKSQAPVSVLSEISSRLKGLFSEQEIMNLVAGVGRFPSDNGIDSFSPLVPWSSVRRRNSDFLGAFDTAFGSKPGVRNFAAAIRDIIDEIKSRNHKQGAVIFVVKTAPETNTAELTTELEILGGILDTNMKVYAIEIQGNSVQPGIALANLVEKSEGEHLIIGSPDDLSKPMINYFLSNLTDELKSTIQIERKTKSALREIISPETEVIVRMKGMESLQVMAIPLTGNIVGPTLLKGDTGNQEDLVLNEFTSWGENENKTSSKKSYLADLPLESLSDELSWGSFKYECTSESCQVILIALASVQNTSAVFDDISISVFTSAVNNEVDLAVSNALSDANAAFAIYAKVEQSGVALKYKEGLSVTATIYLEDGSTAAVIDLIDDGKVIPDISLNDGVFSGIYIPNSDGFYKILVTAKYVEIPEAVSTNFGTDDDASFNSYDSNFFTSRSEGKLFPIDQSLAGCAEGILGCSSMFPDREFTKTVEFPGAIHFKNSDKFIAFADWIHDLRITPVDGNNIELEWTHPGERGPQTGLIQADLYDIRQSDSFDDLLFAYEIQEEFPPVLYTYPGVPGTTIKVSYSYGRESKKYFAIRTKALANRMDPSLPMVTSKIASVNIQEKVIVTTTTTTTTVSPITSTTTTTQRPSTTTGSTTPDVGDSTTTQPPGPTSKRTTTARPTTTTTTTKRTTTQAPSTATKAPDKHWFEETEGIITIAVFGGAILLLLAGGLTFLWFTKFR